MQWPPHKYSAKAGLPLAAGPARVGIMTMDDGALRWLCTAERQRLGLSFYADFEDIGARQLMSAREEMADKERENEDLRAEIASVQAKIDCECGVKPTKGGARRATGPRTTR